MSLTFNIADCVAWASGLESTEDWALWQAGQRQLASELRLPPLDSIPAMQRRRLSPYAKLALHCALQASANTSSQLPLVFASRHGDLHRTAGLIEDVAQGNDLSPTQFGLSVHNAAAGLYSILTGNRSPISAIAAGDSSFMVGLLDSVAKLKANKLARILYVYCDMVVPDYYQNYVEHDESVAIGLLLEATAPQTAEFSLQLSADDLPVRQHQALEFMEFYLGDAPQCQLKVNQQSWCLQRHS